MASEFDQLVYEIRTARRAPSRLSAGILQEIAAGQRRRPNFQKAIAEQSESAASAALAGFKPGQGVRIDGREGGFQVIGVDVDGQVQIRQVRDKGVHPVGMNFDDASVGKADPALLRPAAEFDAPDMPETFAKALEISNRRASACHSYQTAHAEIKRSVADIKARALAGVRAGTITAHEAAKIDVMAGRLKL